MIAKKSDAQIAAQLEKADKIVKVDGSYDYLLSMPMKSMTGANLDRLKGQMKDLKAQLDRLKGMSAEELWQDDLNEFKKAYFK